MEWALSDEAGFTSKYQADRFVEYIEEIINNWKPRKKFSFTSDSEKSNKVLNHKLIY
jgi:propanediol dehydratase small subunit